MKRSISKFSNNKDEIIDISILDVCPYKNIRHDEKLIDAVIYYVNFEDPEWYDRYNSIIKESKISNISVNNDGNAFKANRIADYGTLKYVLRSIDKNMKFINQIYLVVQSESQVPSWINRSTVNVILHEDFIPEEFLPTYNSTTMDIFLHRIPGLSEKFILFNDDMIVMNELESDNFFIKGRTKDIFYEYPIDFDPHYGSFYKQWRINAEEIICSEFNEDLNFFHEPPHGPGPMLKSDIEYLFNKYENDIKKRITTFRNSSNIEQYLWRLYSWKKNGCINDGLNCKVINCGDPDISNKLKQISVDFNTICINDIGRNNNYNFIKNEINDTLQTFFPNTSKYEKSNKVACCVISKDEEKYLIEWIEYYKSLGFDSILFGDNNNPGNNSQYDILKRYIDDGFVIYHDLRGDNNYQQQKFYQHCYNKYGNIYDWIAFFDVDEFLELCYHDNISDFLTSNWAFYNNDIIHFSWINYGDNGLLTYEDKPVRERFRLPSDSSMKSISKYTGMYRENDYVKSIVRCGNPNIQFYKIVKKNIKTTSGIVHAPGCNVIKYAVNAKGEKVPNILKHTSCYDFAHLKHYRTKTVEEYLYKLDRGDVTQGLLWDYSYNYQHILTNRFFITNELTPEKRSIFAEKCPNIYLDNEWCNIRNEHSNIITSDIDYVFPYVDGTDPLWASMYKKYHNGNLPVDHDDTNLNGENRYINYDLLKYKFRSMEKNMPWIRNIFVIVSSPSQIPDWLDTSKVKIVYHKDFIPSEFLPTFSSLTIEMFLGNIKELGDKFIYSNDDMYYINNLYPCDFFYKDRAVMNFSKNPYALRDDNDKVREHYYEIYSNSTKLVMPHYNQTEELFIFRHCSRPFTKRSFQDILETHKDVIYKSITADRDRKNLSMMQMATLYNMKDSIPNTYEHDGWFLKDDQDYFINKIQNLNSNKYKEISIDTLPTATGKEMKMVAILLDNKFPNKSKYEK